MMTMLVRSSAIRLRLRASKYRCLKRWKQSREHEKAGGAKDSKPTRSGVQVVDLSLLSRLLALGSSLRQQGISFSDERGQVPCQLAKFLKGLKTAGILKGYRSNACARK